MRELVDALLLPIWRGAAGGRDGRDPHARVV